MRFSARKRDYLPVYMRKEGDIGAGRVHEEQDVLLLLVEEQEYERWCI